jgi:hypothetical protein
MARSVRTHHAHFSGLEGRKTPAVGQVFFLDFLFYRTYRDPVEARNTCFCSAISQSASPLIRRSSVSPYPFFSRFSQLNHEHLAWRSSVIPCRVYSPRISHISRTPDIGNSRRAFHYHSISHRHNRPRVCRRANHKMGTCNWQSAYRRSDHRLGKSNLRCDFLRTCNAPLCR